MRYILALWILCSVASAEDVFKPTGKYIEVTTGNSDPVTLERTDNPRRFSFSSKMPAVKQPQRQWYLVSEPWCGSCPAAKQRFLSLGWSEDNILTMAECQAKFGFKPDHVPFEFGEPVVSHEINKPRQSAVNVSQMSHRTSQQSACPGGRCPVPTRRRRLFK